MTSFVIHESLLIHEFVIHDANFSTVNFCHICQIFHDGQNFQKFRDGRTVKFSLSGLISLPHCEIML